VKIFIRNKPVQIEAWLCHYMKAKQDMEALRRQSNLKGHESWVLAPPAQSSGIFQPLSDRSSADCTAQGTKPMSSAAQ